MMALHELGHVIHAVLSGTRVERVTLPLAGFSYTAVSNNLHPAFVAWGGPLWGGALPLAASLILERFRWPLRKPVQFFSGFCLVVNGSYIGAGSWSGAGDAGDLLRHGAPVGLLTGLGAVAVAAGLYQWHRLDRTRAS
jgi:hypothetical protein